MLLAVDLTTAPVLGGVLGLAVVALFAVWLIPKHQARKWATAGIEGKELVELENSARGTLVQIVGGIALILTFAATWLQIADTRKATNRTLKLNAAQQETERFTRAVDELGSRRAEIRLGGIFVLDRVALDTPRERGPVVQLMLAYLHDHHQKVRRLAFAPPTFREPCETAALRAWPDMQAALSVVLDFPSAGRRRFDLTSIDLHGAKAKRPISLTRI
jgi:hypothetical protein